MLRGVQREVDESTAALQGAVRAVRRGSARHAGHGVIALLRELESGPAAVWLARALVCTYFLNQAYEHFEVWSYMRNVKYAPRWRGEPLPPSVTFPIFSVGLVFPAAVLAALGVLVAPSALVLLLRILWDDAHITWRRVAAMVRHGSRPTEPLMRGLACLGCVLLVLTHTVRSGTRRRPLAPAGPLVSDDGRPQPGRRRSLLLLGGRLLISCMFLFSGLLQLRRIVARGGTMRQSADNQHYGMPDSHDNNWNLLLLLMAVPFALGVQTASVSRLLCGVLLLEALVCWPFWSSRWPTWHHRAHARSHFFLDVALSGGLLLLRQLGPGRFTADRLMGVKEA